MKQNSNAIKDQLKTALDLDVSTSKIVVVGLGVTGISVARYLKRIGFEFVISDSREQLSELLHLQEEIGDIKVYTGAFDKELFCNATHLIVSPGIPLTENAIQQASMRGTKVISDIDLFACSVDAPIIAITGSNGKSTVTTMVGDMAIASGLQAGVGGNLGLAALDLLDNEAELYVLELSSFQLERTSQLNAAAAVVLNITADHLDRHKNLVDYAEQKRHVYSGDGVMVINIDDPLVLAMQEKGRNSLTFSTKGEGDFWIAEKDSQKYLMHNEKQLMPLCKLPLEGRHNAANALAALALGTAVGLDEKAMCKALESFKGLAHRMQRVAEIEGIIWINDSKATNIGACIAALQGSDRKVVLIAGGDAKGADMNELLPTVKEKVKSVILMGKDAGLIERALAGCVPLYKVKNMIEAVDFAYRVAKSGETVLLSPACASLDQYKNYQDRGDKFTDAVNSLVNRYKVNPPETSKVAS
jgi:UDP-N-acetylmuramoylalanine--D-glutamate ligase